MSNVKHCYQCDKETVWLAPDSRCSTCTGCTPEDVAGSAATAFVRAISKHNPWTLGLIHHQLQVLKSYRMNPIGISVSMDILMNPDVARLLVVVDGKQQLLFNLPLTIVGDKSDVVAWSFAL